MLGGAVRDELQFYATGARPDLAKEMCFIGGKLPLHHGPAEGREGLEKTIALPADMRAKCGDDFWLIYACWMSLAPHLSTRPHPPAREQCRHNRSEEGPPPGDY